MIDPLPTPLRERRAAMEALLREQIRAQGLLPFDRFMELALYAPGLGYYRGGLHKFGAAGDFTTAPELSPLFAGCIARYCAHILDADGELIEFGGGSGRLAADLLPALDALGALPARYTLIELSAELRARQRETLERLAPEYLSRVAWSDAPPTRHQGVILANEVLDAMPVSRFRVAGDERLEEHFIDRQEDRLVGRWLPVRSPGLEAFIRAHVPLETLPRGYQSEICPRAAAWIEALAEIPGKRLVLLIDYGYPAREYYLPERDRGTLMCHFQHRAHPDPLAHPGIQDITAHVDFSLIARSAEARGLRLAGYTHQAGFLLANGLDAQLAGLDPEDTENWLRAVQAAKTLTLPSGMGERFGVMALQRGIGGNRLPPLGLRDLRTRL